MYKLLIVDDEKEIRDGLAAWRWDNAEIEVAGVCSHGLEALQFVGEHPVDILITDIRMPFMDGIELMTALNQRFPFIRVIILSGYSDFEYARKAVQHGAIDYLLKPLQFQALQQTIGRVVEKLREERQAEYRVSVLKRKAEMLTQVLRGDFLRRLFRDRMSEEDREQGCSEGEVLLDGGYYTVAVFRPDRLAAQRAAMKDKELKLLHFSLDNILNDLWEARELGYHWVNEATGEAYVLCTDADANRHFSELLPQWRKYKGLFKSVFSVGVGHTVRHPADIHLSAKAAEHALKESEGGASVAYYEPVSSSHEQRQTTGAVIRPFPDLDAGSESNSLILVQAKQFIRNNYQRSLTLREVADHVHISTSHLFALFKSSGETFLNYVTAIRMQKSTELLRGTSLKIYEIVEKVGYSDPAYFTGVFKKYTGKTPNEYRGKSR